MYKVYQLKNMKHIIMHDDYLYTVGFDKNNPNGKILDKIQTFKDIDKVLLEQLTAQKVAYSIFFIEEGSLPMAIELKILRTIASGDKVGDQEFFQPADRALMYYEILKPKE